ncbi:biotin synthase BioB [Candidatus Termititenax aidoneus]|uniref:Biotin synthase n=1 Tax=Termititenax aidoneus TaxID=2218524 RepID=A0A388T8D4_TERA1|nr:biotin synthase BioB [Candidatus Termititenax aidoneus]
MPTKSDGLAILNTPVAELPELMRQAREIRDKHTGQHAQLCSIVNAKSGACPEDCAYCAQSGQHQTGVETYALLPPEKILAKALLAKKNGAHCFGIVTSGKGLSPRDIEQVVEAVRLIAAEDIHAAASLGIIEKESLQKLKNAGLRRYHHNLETAESYFAQICTTHTYEDRVRTARAAKAVGLELCCGGIIGLGETKEQRVELVMALAELAPESVPLNFLNPIAGTRLANLQPLDINDICRTIALFRFFLPDKNIGVMGGREQLLRDRQDLVFEAGANGFMLGDYLTTAGNSVESDYALVAAAGLTA